MHGPFNVAMLEMVTFLDDNSDVFNKTALFRKHDGVVQESEVVEMAHEYQFVQFLFA